MAAEHPLLSCSLPLSSRPYQARVFFTGLLPEGQHRQAMAAEARVPSYDAFGLLGRYGKDVAGAAVIAHDNPGDRPGDVVAYDRDGLEAEVASRPERPLGLHDDSELSIAGLQDKLVLVDLAGGRWGRPVHGRPSTHILKVEDRRYAGMAEMEGACLRLARAAGLTAVEVQLDASAGVACAIVSRFDRRVDADGGVTRLHQEDACRALGRDPDASRGRGKYERAGGPALGEVATCSTATAPTRVPGPRGYLHRGDRQRRRARQEPRVGAHLPGRRVARAHVRHRGDCAVPNLRAEAAVAVNGRSRLDVITLDDIAEAAGDGARLLLDAAQAEAIPKQLGKVVGARAKALLAT